MASKLILEIVAKAQTKELEGIGNKLQRTGFALSKFVTLPLLGAGAAAFKFASDADEATSKAKRVFGRAFSSIEKDAQSLDDAFSEAQFLDAAGTFGQMAQAMGFTADESANLSKEWLGMAQDFASFNNLDIEETLAAIRSGISGEFEPLKRMGVLINEASLKAKALELGLWDGVGALDAHAKAAATTALITEQMGAAQGDFAATADGAANSSRILAGNLADMAAEIGTQLLPVGIAILQWLKDALAAFQSLPQPVKDIIVPIAALAAAIGPLLFLGGKLISAFGAIKTAFVALKVLMLTNPFTALALAVATIAALIILNWDKISKFLKEVWDKIAGGVRTLGNILEGAWKGIQQTVTSVWNAVVGIIKGAINGVIDVINGFFGFLNGIQIGIPSIDVGPVHVGGGTIDPFNIPLIPRLAEGGIVDGATLALIGEKGPEAVIPLDKLRPGMEFHSHIEVRGEEPFIRNEADLNRAQQRLMFLEGF